jgi:hypothetical protein
MATTTYTSKRGTLYFIEPTRLYSSGFDWYADDYDGAPDGGDNRCGWGVPSIEEAIEDIEETEDMAD